MKCPKCGYNSFEINDLCKKCAHDLTAFKLSHGLKPIVLPQETRAELAAALKTAPEQEQEATPQPTAETPYDMFSFDIPEEKEAAGIKTIDQDDFFKFGDPPAAAPSTGFGTFSFDDEPATNQAKAVEDAFADLLETSPSVGADPSAGQKTALGGGTTDEYELSSFSWDEPGETSIAGEKKPDDDFESLFGDINSNAKK